MADEPTCDFCKLSVILGELPREGSLGIITRVHGEEKTYAHWECLSPDEQQFVLRYAQNAV